MSWSKRALIEQSFDELALASYSFDLSPEEMQAALARMDAMVASWSALGMALPYAFAGAAGEGGLDDDSGLPQVAIEAVYLGLALRTAASKGKVLAASTKAAASNAYSALATWVARQQLQQQQFKSGTPQGAGRKPWRTVTQPFMTQPDTDPLQLADDGGLNLTGV